MTDSFAVAFLFTFLVLGAMSLAAAHLWVP